LHARIGGQVIAISGTPPALTVIDADKGARSQLPVPGLGSSFGPFRLSEREDHVVFEGSTNSSPGLGYGSGYAAFSFDLRHPGPPLLLGTGGYFLPSNRPDRIWFVTHPDAPNQTVREVTTTGEITIADIQLPKVHVAGVTSRGLLIRQDGQLRLWNTRSRQTVTTMPGSELIAADGDLVATCDATCQTLTITDVSTGRHRTLTAPNNRFISLGVLGTFSPDHRRLALLLLAQQRDTTGPAASALIDTATGKFTTANQLVDGPSALAWNPDSTWLFFLAGTTGYNQIGAMQSNGDVYRVASDPLVFPQRALIAVPPH
jgi:WD40 repeat protein